VCAGFVEGVRRYHLSIGANDHIHADLAITVSRSYGDPDIYVTNNLLTGEGIYPDPTNRSSYAWSSTAFGEDMVIIPRDNPCRNSDACTYYIVVVAFTATSYTINAGASDAPTMLTPRVGMRADVHAGETEYFSFLVEEAGHNVTISVTDVAQGDPDLYVSCKPDQRKPNSSSM